MVHKDRLTPLYIDLHPQYLDDYLALAMYNVENALKTVGAKPKEDYTYKNLIDWAIRYVSEKDDDLKIVWQPKNK
jgi:hypothetical protein